MFHLDLRLSLSLGISAHIKLVSIINFRISHIQEHPSVEPTCTVAYIILALGKIYESDGIVFL